MRIAVDAAVLGSGRGGDESYLRGLLLGLAQVADPSRDVVGLFGPDATAPAEVATHASFRAHATAPAGRVARYLYALPRAVARSGAGYELLLSINHAPLVSGIPRALIVHDLSFLRHPEFYPRSTRLRLRTLVPLHVRQARVVICGSEFSRADLIDAFGLDPERVRVVPPVVRMPTAAARPATAAPYFLYVGNRHPRKNLDRLVEAFTRARAGGLTHELVIAGATWWRDDGLASRDGVRVVGRVSDAERDALLVGATALVYPSLFEGIGLPPLEAMALGTPVIAASAGALPETCADAAVLVDPYDINAIADALGRVAADDALRGTLRERGRARVAQFTARRAGEAAYAAFASAISARERAVAGVGELRGS